MPYGYPPEGPKSGCRYVEAEFMLRSQAELCLSMGSFEMSVLQMLLAGNSGHSSAWLLGRAERTMAPTRPPHRCWPPAASRQARAATGWCANRAESSGSAPARCWHSRISNDAAVGRSRSGLPAEQALAQYRGIVHHPELTMNVPLTISDFLRRVALVYPDRPALIDAAGTAGTLATITYRSRERRARGLAIALDQMGVGHGEG